MFNLPAQDLSKRKDGGDDDLVPFHKPDKIVHSDCKSKKPRMFIDPAQIQELQK